MSKKTMSEDEAAFRAKIKEDPKDSAPKGVFADWLDEQGRHFEAEVWRHEAGIQICFYGSVLRNGYVELYPSLKSLSANSVLTKENVRQNRARDRFYRGVRIDITGVKAVCLPLRPTTPVFLTGEEFTSLPLPRAVNKEQTFSFMEDFVKGHIPNED